MKPIDEKDDIAVLYSVNVDGNAPVMPDAVVNGGKIYSFSFKDEREIPGEHTAEYPSRTLENFYRWSGAKAITEKVFGKVIVLNGYNPWCLAAGLYRVEAVRRELYIDRNPSQYMLENEIQFFSEIFMRFDSVLCSDKAVRKSFVAVFPELNEKTFVVSGLRTAADVSEKADKIMPLENGRKYRFFMPEPLADEKETEPVFRFIRNFTDKFEGVQWFLSVNDEIYAKSLRNMIFAGLSDEITFTDKRYTVEQIMACADMCVLRDTDDSYYFSMAERLGCPAVYVTSASEPFFEEDDYETINASFGG